MHIARISNRFRDFEARLNSKQQTWHKLSVATATLVFASLFLAAPASTLVASAAPLVGSAKLCLDSDQFQCAKSEGIGSQMKAEHAGYSMFSVSGPASATIYTNGSGNCVHGTSGSGTQIVTVSSSCGSGNTASQWQLTNWNGKPALKNVAYGKYLYSTGDQDGDGLVIAAGGTSGLWLVTQY